MGIEYWAFFLLLTVYLFPTIIAFRRGKKNRWAIFACNLFLGPIYGIGWVIALIWSLMSEDKPGESDLPKGAGFIS